jgi:hypothetical protein
MDIGEAKGHLDNLYGVPGEDNETGQSMDFLWKLFREMGVSALTEEAAIRLAELQVDYENTPRY